MLKAVKNYSDEGYISKSVRRNNSGDNVIIKGANPNQHFYFMPLPSYQLLWLYYDMETGGSDDNSMKIAGLSVGSDGKGQLQYEQAVSINANSANKDLAWAFIKFMEEVTAPQSLDIRGTLIYKPGDAENVKNTITGEIKANANGSGGPPAGQGSVQTDLTPEEQKAFNDYMAAIDSYTKDINKFLIPLDASIQNMINTELESYFYGEKSAEDVASNLQNQIDLYLNE